MACPVCGSGDARAFATARDVEYSTGDAVYEYFECGGCGAVYLADPPVDRLQEIYPGNYYSYRQDAKGLLERIKRHLDAKLLRGMLDRIPGDALRVLDVGGGSGWLLSLTREVSPRVTETHEVDLDEGARGAAEAAGHTFHCTRIETFASEKTFDLVLMLNLIEHVSDPRAVLEAMRRMLSPGGLILLKTPNTDTLDRRLFRRRYWGGLHAPRHWVLFTMPGLTRLAAECGLEVVEAKYTQGGPQWAMSIVGSLARRGRVRITKERPMVAHPLTAPLVAAGAAFDFLRMPFAPTAQMFVTLARKT